MDGHVATAADAAHPRFHGPQRQTRGHRRIDSVAALPENRCADFGSRVVLRGHEAVAPFHGPVLRSCQCSIMRSAWMSAPRRSTGSVGGFVFKIERPQNERVLLRDFVEGVVAAGLPAVARAHVGLQGAADCRRSSAFAAWRRTWPVSQ